MEAVKTIIERTLLHGAQISADDLKHFKESLGHIDPSPNNIVAVRHLIFNSPKEHHQAISKLNLSQVLQWTEDLVGTLESVLLRPVSKHHFALFFPSDNSLRQILALLNGAKSSLEICVFTITDNRISSAIKGAHGRGVNVRIVTDDEKANDLGADIYELKKFGIPTKIDNSPAHMHHKFCIIDNQILITGSFNFTTTASSANCENMVVLDDADLVSSYKGEFERLWTKFSTVDDTNQHQHHDQSPHGHQARSGHH